jgi:hypothetical protein
MTLKGTTKEFPLDVVLRLLKDSKKTGELAMRGPKGEGALGLAEGRVVTAVYGSEKPIPALGAVFDLGEVDFEFVPWTEAPAANLEGELEENLKRADEYAKWLADVREVIPHDGIRFRLSERAADQGAVTFTADRWRVVMAVNTRPSVTELATNLHIDRDDALTTLAGLVRDGVIETTDEPAPAAGPAPAPGPPPAAESSAPFTSAPPEPTTTPEPAPAEPAPAQEPEDWTAALVRKATAQTEPEPSPPPLPPSATESAPTETPGRTQSTATPADAWSAIPSTPPAVQDSTDPAPVPDWTSSPATDVPAWSPAPSEPPATDWGAVPTTPLPEDTAPPPPPPDWTSGGAASSAEWTAPPQEWSPAQTPPPPDWTSAPAPTEPPPFIQEPAPPAPASFGAPEPAAPEPAAAEPAADPLAEPAAPAANEWATAPAEPAPMDDRLAALQGMFDKPAPAQPSQEWTRPANDTWVTPGKTTPAAEDPRLSAMSAPAPAPPAAPTPASSTRNEWGPPPPGFGAPAPAQPKKGGGLFGGLFGAKKAAETSPAASATNGGAASRAGKLAAFSNALLTEYTSGTYGKGKVDDRMPSLLMRVDEQADPIDRPLPVVDDRLDVQALERVNMAEQQAVPYLATLVATIFGDAEKAFGKDKAKRGYKAAQQQIFGGDTSVLSGPDLAGKLPKI